MSDDTVERLRRDFDTAWRLSIAHGEEVTRCDLADTTMFFLDRVIHLLEGVIQRERAALCESCSTGERRACPLLIHRERAFICGCECRACVGGQRWRDG